MLTAKMKNSRRKLKLAAEVKTRAGGVFDVFGVLHAVYNAIYTTRFFFCKNNFIRTTRLKFAQKLRTS